MNFQKLRYLLCSMGFLCAIGFSGLFLSPGIVLAADAPVYEVEEYVVQQGDTLWDIATDRLENPFLWPKVWQINPEIYNADLIFPGQIIRIPIDLLKPELRPVARKAPVPVPVPVEPPPEPEPEAKPDTGVPVKKVRYLAHPDLVANAGFVTDSLPGFGEVLGSETERVLFGNGDRVYVDATDAAVGKRYSIYRELRDVIHPVTREPYGKLIEVLGSLEINAVEKGGTTATILDAFTDINQGSLLGKYYEEEAPLVTEVPRTPEISGYILEMRELRIVAGGRYDVLYLDQGESAGLRVGDILTVRRHPPKGTKYEALFKEIATIQVVRTEPKTATAVILVSIIESRKGDHFGPVEE